MDAPIIEEYPVTLECELVEEKEESYGLRFLGRTMRDDIHAGVASCA